MTHKSMKYAAFVLIAFIFSWSIVRAQSPETLTLWARFENEQAQPLLDSYNARLRAAGRDTEWVYEQVASGDVSTRLASGESPDAVGIDLVQAPQLLMSSSFLDLTARFDSLNYHAEINPQMLNLGSVDGRIFAVPFVADVSVLVYNRTLLQNAGLDPHQALETWDSLRVAAQTLTSDGVVGYELWCGDGDWLMYSVLPFVWANGGNLFNADGTLATLDNPALVEAVQFLSDMNVIDHSTAPSGTAEGCAEEDFNEASPDFAQETMAIMPRSGAYMAYLIQAYPEIDLGVTLIPSKDAGTGSSFIGGDLIAIPTISPHPDEAWDLIQYLLSAEVQVETLAQAGYVPVRADLAENSITDADPRFSVLTEALAIGDVPSTPFYSDLTAAMQVGLRTALNGDLPVTDALEAANAEFQQVVDLNLGLLPDNLQQDIEQHGGETFRSPTIKVVA